MSAERFGEIRRRPRRRMVLGALAVGALVLLVVVVRSGDEGSTDGSNRERATRVLDHASGTGEVIAAPPALVEQVSTAAGLRVGLRVLLTRHVVLTLHAVDGAVADAADLEATARALRANSQDIGAAITLVYGEEGARAFDELWSQHAQFLVEHGVALGEGDAGAAEEARVALDHYHRDFSSFCSLVTGLPRPSVEDLIGLHVDRLIDYGLAVAEGDRRGAARLLDAAIVEVAEVADALAGAIVEQHPETFPGAVGDADATADAVSAVLRTGAALVEAQRASGAGLAGPEARWVEGLSVPGAARWADALAALRSGRPAPDGTTLARALELSGSAGRALAEAFDGWVAAVEAHRRAVLDGAGPGAAEAVGAVDEAGVALGVALAGGADGGGPEPG